MAEPAPLKGIQLFVGAFALSLANFVVVLDSTIANVSVPHIAGGLAVSPTQGTWVITSYAVADAITVPLTGWLAARFGSVRWFMVSIIGFGLFSILCGLSQTLEALIFFRVIQGFFGGPLMPLSQTMLLRIFPQERRAVAIALWAMTTTSAPIVGPILGGLISDNWSWPWIFFINLPVVAFSGFFVARYIRRFETPSISKRIDLIGLALLILFVGAFQVMLDIGREQNWFESGVIIALAVTAAVGFGAFVIWEWTEPDPVVDIRIFRNRGFTAGALSVSVGFGAFFASIVLTPLWLQQVVGYTASEAGRTLAWVGVFAVLLAPLVARLSSVLDVRMTACLGMIWMGGVSMMRLGWTSDSDYWTLALPQLFQGMAMPFIFIGLTALAMGSVAPKDQVSAAGLMSFLRTLSGAIGTTLAATAYESGSHVARSELVPKLNGAETMAAQLQASGYGAEQARAIIERLVEGQAATLSMLHVFTLAGIAFLTAAAIIWVAPKPQAGPLMGAH
jgi:MFS transporter, DHA2 family, multidrug resistance protein